MADSTTKKSYRIYHQKKLKKSRSKTTKFSSHSSNISRPPLKQTLFSKEYINNKYNLLRIIVLSINLILLLVCILYGVGSVLILSLDDIWCKYYTWGEVSQQNRQLNNSTGVGGCYQANNVQRDLDKLLATEVTETGLKAEDDINFGNVIKSMIFFSMALILIILFFTYLFVCLVDCKKTVTDEWGRKRQKSSVTHHSKNTCCIGNDTWWSSKLPKFLWRMFVKLVNLIKENTLIDSPVAIISLQMKEAIEIVLQS